MKYLIAILVFLAWLSPKTVLAREQKLGVHIFDPGEIAELSNVLPGGGYVTVVMRTDQLDSEIWQRFLDQAHEKNIIPIIRLATIPHKDKWLKPTRKDIVSQAAFLSSLRWPGERLIIVAFNEPNHAAEWGGEISPHEYGQMLTFLVDWFRTENRQYTILSAALDAAAPNSATTMRADNFLAELVSYFPVTMRNLGGISSHSYANPGFSGLPTDTHRMSVRSYKYELKYIQDKLDVALPVYITETGWDRSKRSDAQIARYFRQVYERVWQPDPAVISVTPFVYSAPSGPFVHFSLLDQKQMPTALLEMIKILSQT